ncbi:MAG: hypothetical protein L6R42_007776 [Xanthoria sp. 1 TBL-2021]|nr:MAG: hypothetical protein L6R42_007776 [Xanthoria sp. 1 TBL-2021]
MNRPLLSTFQGKTSSGAVLDFVVANRATTQIVVSFVGSVLAGFNAYTATKMLNLSTRVHLLDRPLSLNQISFIRAISTDENLHSDYGTLLAYNHTELGYLTTVSCFANTSSDFHLELMQEGKNENGIPYIYYAIGAFPHNDKGQDDFFAVTGVYGDENIAAVAAKRYRGRSVIMITSGSNYPELNQTQCEVSLVPTVFSVIIDTANKTINVTPLYAINTSDSTASTFDPTGGLALTAINQINGLGMISTSLHTSIVGDALMSNIKAARLNPLLSDHDDFAAIGDSFSAITDEILQFVASSQFFVPQPYPGDSSTVDAHLTIKAVRLGDLKYVVGTFGVCAALLLAVLFEACRTKFWKWLPLWDFMDTKSLILSSAVAGTDILAALCRTRDIERMDWTGGYQISWDGNIPQPVPDVRLKLRRKRLNGVAVERMMESKGSKNDEATSAEDRSVKVTAVSLWPCDTRPM